VVLGRFNGTRTGLSREPTHLSHVRSPYVAALAVAASVAGLAAVAVVDRAAAPPALAVALAASALAAAGWLLIHARRHAGTGQAQREAFYRALFEDDGEYRCVIDAAGSVVYRCPGMDAVLGFRPAAADADPFHVVHPDDLARARAALAELVAHPGARRETTVRLRFADGAWRAMEATARNLLDDPAVRGIVVTARDVTDRDRALEHARFQAHLLDAVGQAVLATDPTDRVTYMNRAAEALFGRPAADVEGRLLAELHPGGPLLHDSPAGREALGDGEAWSAEFDVHRPDGSVVPAFGTVSPLYDDDGRSAGCVTVAVDITERRQTEARLREQEERLELSRKLEAVGKLAGGVAHDFNNLITGMTGFVELALAALPDDSPVRADLAQVLRTAERATALTRQLLAFSRRQVLQARVVELNAVVADLVGLLGRVIGDHIVLDTRLAAGPIPVLVDPGQLEQVILNLAVNARDAMPDGGRLAIETAVAELTERDADDRPYEVRPGRYAVLTVRDTGTGIEPAILDRVFEPFFTTKEPGRGTGLGLSTVYGIVKQSDGYVWIRSTPGVGTRVQVYLPLVAGASDGAAARPAGPERAAVAAAGPDLGGGAIHQARLAGSETVLLVEDDDTVRALTRRVLHRHGYRVLEARNGAEALRMAGPDRAIDLVLTDIVMPELGGRQLVERLRASRPDVPVLLMSGYTEDAAVRRDIASAGARFLAKPFTADALARMVRAAIDADD
jgi:two-component system cell cycle sensor histidine kinase/response regulator CckA